MSDTPRTDALWKAIREWTGDVSSGLCCSDELSAASEDIENMERELSAANARIKELEKDAARYKWLHDADPSKNGPFIGSRYGPSITTMTGEFADAVIDKAREA